jgi:hypothetical protein
VADDDRDGRPAKLETVTGGNHLGASPPSGASVAVIAYNSGVSDQPTSCVAVVRYENGYPTFDCPGFSGGTSGSPWLTWDPVARHYVVHAVIGGPKGADAPTRRHIRHPSTTRSRVCFPAPPPAPVATPCPSPAPTGAS